MLSMCVFSCSHLLPQTPDPHLCSGWAAGRALTGQSKAESEIGGCTKLEHRTRQPPHPAVLSSPEPSTRGQTLLHTGAALTCERPGQENKRSLPATCSVFTGED